VSELPALVLLHGFTNTGACWAPVLAAGAGQRYRAVAPDIRGHGSASRVRPVTLAGVLDDLRALEPERFTLAGYSQGGRIALHAALADGLASCVERLVLIGASPGLPSAEERAARVAADSRLASSLETSTIEEFALRWAAAPVLAGLPPNVAEAAHADRLVNTVEGLAAALRSLGTGALPSLWDRLGELRMPVTLIVGERDLKFQEIASEMAGLIPQCAVEIVPGAGHAVHLERPDAVAALL
jgi:2-succinyl-6-hydroxy-2,4-cyclohexadiene-1-carboxylate synthase